MSSVLTNLSVIQKLARDLVQAKHLNYSQQCLPYYIDESRFAIENIQDLRNPSGFLLKASLIRHRAGLGEKGDGAEGRKNGEEAGEGGKEGSAARNCKCVVFLHGLGSSRLQALPLVDCLPEEYCLFAFDLAGSGKSQGDNITYGLRESQDICSILDYLRTNKGLKQFIIWGRSMGAVASLLYSINLAQNSKNSISAQSQLHRIRGLVIDSPFSDFRQVTKQIGLKRINIPQFLMDFALSIIEQKFNEILLDETRSKKLYNPFSIKLGCSPIETRIPTVFLYSEIDQVVPKQHSEKIIKVYKSLFDKIIMKDCSHNQARPKEIVERVFGMLGKFQGKRNGRVNGGVGDVGGVGGRGLMRNGSFQQRDRGRRGISVESREKDKERSAVVIENVNTENSEAQTKDSKITLHSYSSLKIEPRRDKISCKMSKNAYTGDSPTATNQSPLKIRLSNSFNRPQNKISISASKKPSPSPSPSPNPMPSSHTHTHTYTHTNFYNTIEYDNSILQKKLLKQSEQHNNNNNGNGNGNGAYKTLENRNNFKYRRGSQLTRKVQYQLNHTRYL